MLIIIFIIIIILFYNQVIILTTIFGVSFIGYHNSESNKNRGK